MNGNSSDNEKCFFMSFMNRVTIKSVKKKLKPMYSFGKW